MTDLTARYYNQLPQTQLPQSNGGMMAQHTPGPWQITGPNIRSEDGALLFVQGDQFMDDDPDPIEQAANRRLVAAAPELLAAAQNAITNWDNSDYTGLVEWIETTMESLKAAILKTGPSGLEG
jgi:hypothetical protein